MSTWTLDTAHSTIGFAVRHMMFAKVHGAFTKWEAKLDLDETDVTKSKVTVTVDAASIDTRETQRDQHLKSADFLDVAKFPQITFESRMIVAEGAEKVQITGPLTVHGVTQDITLEIERLGSGKDPWGNQRLAFSGKTTINRKEFGVVYNQVLETGGVLVSEKIEVYLELQAVAAKP
jgi:polyisoprenoid-binding protein YceI